MVDRTANRRIGSFVALTTAMTLLWMHGISGSVHGSELHASHEVAEQTEHEALADAPTAEAGLLVGCASAACAVALAGSGARTSAQGRPPRAVRTAVKDRSSIWSRAPEPPVPLSVSIVS